MGIWWKIDGRVSKGGEAAASRIATAEAKADKAASDLAAHKLHAAETFVTKAGMQEQTAQIMRAIEGVGNRIDSVHERLDRAFECTIGAHDDNLDEILVSRSSATVDGLIKATILEIPDDEDPSLLYVEYSVHRLTMRGHDFLGNIKEPSNREAIKESTKKVGAVTVDAAVSLAQAYIKAKIPAYTGGAVVQGSEEGRSSPSPHAQQTCIAFVPDHEKRRAAITSLGQI
ncbi:DUF2513 domain-containing protein [Rhizobium grahamii]|uniref:DUF2513 domain-containing protein n=1 Tax=Rhizobium grahamii TaxID=1120045 RepID=UPI0016799282|nr:DUF2513 domain-containing protein [Rhizobium grahamii]